MTVVNLRTLATVLGGSDLLKRAVLQASAWAGSAPYVARSGADVLFPHTLTVQITDGVPDVPVDLAPTDARFCWRLELSDLVQGHRLPSRFVAVPEVGPVDFGDLVDVDPATFVPVSPDVITGWEAATAQITADMAVQVSAAEGHAVAAAEAAASVAPGLPGGTATLDGAGTLPESQVPERLTEAQLSATIGGAIDAAVAEIPDASKAPAADLTPVLIETRDTGLTVKSPDNLRTGLSTTTMTGGGFAEELTIAVTGTAGSAVLASSEPSKVAGLGSNPFVAVLNSADGSDDIFVVVLSQDGTNITLREALVKDFTGTLSAKYDQALGQHLTRAATRAYAQHALRTSGATGGRGAILAGTWDALPPAHNQAWARNAALVAYGTSNSASPIVRTDLTVQGVHNMIHAVDFLGMYPSSFASGVLVGTHQQGHGATATLYTGRAPTVLEFYTAAYRSTSVSSKGFRVRVTVTGDGITLHDRVHDGFMNRILVPVTGVDKIDISVTNDNTDPTPMYLALSNLTLRDAGRSGPVGAGKIVMLGDSWFAFYDAAMGQFVQEKAPGSKVVSHALGGMTTVWGLDWFDEYVVKENPAECWIHFFTNDLNNNQGQTYVGPDGTTKPLWPAGLTADQARDLWARNIRELINRCQRAGIRPVVFMPGGTASESQTQRHGNAAAVFDRPPLRDWNALAAELTDTTSYVNTVGKRTGARVMVGTVPHYATGPAPADVWT